MMKRFTACGAAMLGLAAVAQADPIAWDSWKTPTTPPANPASGEYTANANLNGQNPIISPGWTGAGSVAWTSGTSNLQADPVPNLSLDHPSVSYETGAKGRYIASGTDFYRAAHRRMDNYTPSNTYYMSFILNPAGAFLATGSREHAMVGFTNFITGKAAFEGTNADNVFGLLAGFSGGSGSGTTQNVNLTMRARGGAGTLTDTVMLADAPANVNYYVVYKLEVNAGGAFGAATDRVSWWVDPVNLSSEATMTSSAAASGAVDTLAMETNASIDRASVVTNDYARGFFWDENRFGSTLGAVVPEPSSLLLLGLGGLLLRRRA